MGGARRTSSAVRGQLTHCRERFLVPGPERQTNDCGVEAGCTSRTTALARLRVLPPSNVFPASAVRVARQTADGRVYPDSARSSHTTPLTERLSKTESGLPIFQIAAAQHPRRATAASECDPTVRLSALFPILCHSTSAVACSSTERGIVRPMARAVFRLTTSSKCVGCSIGMVAGFAPLRILSMLNAVR